MPTLPVSNKVRRYDWRKRIPQEISPFEVLSNCQHVLAAVMEETSDLFFLHIPEILIRIFDIFLLNGRIIQGFGRLVPDR